MPAQYGRVFTQADDALGGGVNGPVVVVSHAFWQRRLAGARNIIGTPLIVEDALHGCWRHAGEFLGLEVGQSFNLALPLASEPLIREKDSSLMQPGSYLLFVMLRLKPSQTLQSATALARSLEPEIVPADAPQFIRPFALSPAAEGTSSPSGGAGDSTTVPAAPPDHPDGCCVRVVDRLSQHCPPVDDASCGKAPGVRNQGRARRIPLAGGAAGAH